jgi:hypothetical protein
MNMFREYNIWHIREAGHLLETYWVNPEYKYLKIIISLTLERRVEDTRYGVLFKLA